jgi:hypothetical protein
MAPRRGVRQVAERELDAHALGAQTARIAHQAADLVAARG